MYYFGSGLFQLFHVDECIHFHDCIYPIVWIYDQIDLSYFQFGTSTKKNAAMNMSGYICACVSLEYISNSEIARL